MRILVWNSCFQNLSKDITLLQTSKETYASSNINLSRADQTRIAGDELGRGACVMTTCEHPTHHMNWHTYIWCTDVWKVIGDRARTGQHPPSAFCLVLPHHATIGTGQSVDFVHSAYKTTTFLPHVLKIKQYQEFCYFLRKHSNTIHFWCVPLELRMSVRTWPTCRKYVSKVK